MEVRAFPYKFSSFCLLYFIIKMLFSNQIMYSHIIYEVSDLIFGIFDQMTLDLLDISITNLIVKIMVAVFLKKDHGCSIPFNDDILHTDFYGKHTDFYGKPWLLPLLLLLDPQYCPHGSSLTCYCISLRISYKYPNAKKIVSSKHYSIKV